MSEAAGSRAGRYCGRVTDPIGLSIGSTHLVAARVGAPPITRRSVLTLYRQRPPEVGTPADNPAVVDGGLVLHGFVERIGDPIPLVASDGSAHPAERLLVAALASLAGTAGLTAASEVTIAVPAHWGPGQRRALENALRADTRLGASPRLVSDASAALAALQADPGLPTHGVIALLDFGGSGTGITLFDADAGLAQLGETVRYGDFSGDQIDAAVLSAVLADLEGRGDLDPSATAAVGSLVALREECRRAKERLSAETVTTLSAELPTGPSGVRRAELRYTRAELDAVIAGPLGGMLDALQQSLDRNRIVWARVSAIVTVGGGAAIPIVTQRLSGISQSPVVTTAWSGQAAAIGSALLSARGPDADAATGMSAATAAAATGLAPRAAEPDTAATPAAGIGEQALAWSQAADAVADPLPYDPAADADNPYRPDGPRPRVEYEDDGPIVAVPPRRSRVPQLAVAGAGLIALFAFGSVIYNLANDAKTVESTTPSVTEPVHSEPPPPAPETVEPPGEPEPPPPPPPPVTTTPDWTPTTTEPPVTTTTTTEPTTTTTTTTEPTTTTTTTTEPTTTTTPPTTTTTTVTTTTTPPRMTTTHLNIPGLPPIPIPVPEQQAPQ